MSRILVVDDEVSVRELVARVLGQKGFDVTAVPGADQALFAMEKEIFDLVLTDVNMPGKSGLSLLKTIREAHSKMPIVVYSGVVTAELEKDLRNEGANEVLRKDAGIQVLTEQIAKIVRASGRLFEAPYATSEKTILIVDDEEAVRRLLGDFFRRKGYRIREVESGEKAVEWAEREKPSVVLLDVKMPGMDGLATLQKLLVLHPDLGVLMMTGVQRDEETVNKALTLGAYSYILKPFDFLYLDLVVTSKLIIGMRP